MLVVLLEQQPFAPVTISRLAQYSGVSEAALYKHFPSKDRILSTLLELTDSLLLVKIEKVINRNSQASAITRCEEIACLWIKISETSHGLACVLSGHFLLGASDQLKIRHARLCERFELQLRRLLKEATIKDGLRIDMPQLAASNLIMSTLEGCILRFIRSGFSSTPSAIWPNYWKTLIQGMSFT